MKRYVVLAFVFGFCAGIAGAFEMTFNPNETGSILISSSTVTPTQIFASDLGAMRTFVVNPSTVNVFIVGMSTFSASPLTTPTPINTSLTSGSFYIAGGTNTFAGNGNAAAPNSFSPDGPADPFRGPLWACTNGTSGVSIQRFRAK